MSCTYFLFVLIRHTSTSTLFPYTTLFRSWLATNTKEMDTKFRLINIKYAAVEPGEGGAINYSALAIYEVGEIKKIDETDRKSTRLNSSHRTISYAVFCLKKKNKNRVVRDE